MPNFPVRNLGGAGIVSDIHPYDLPPNAFSSGVNVRFEHGSVTRGPVMRRVHSFDEAFIPAYMFSVPPISAGAEGLVVVDSDFSQVLSILGETVTDITPPVVNEGDTGEPYSHAFLGNVIYLNRGSNVPFMKRQGDSTFVPLEAWDETWRCKILRPYRDFLVALNVTKGAVEYPSMIKWSDFAMFGLPPQTWDETSPTNSAGENIMNQMRGPIVDGAPLRESFYIYGDNEVWAMNYVGGTFMFDFRKRFDDVGVLNRDCVVEVDGQHFVFDRTDIYAHDGASKRSIVHGRNKDFIFQGMIKELAHLSFVSHDPKLSEIHFCYPSKDALTTITGFRNPTTGCNRAAVYNYRRDTWTFYDLPNVVASTNAALATGLSYTSIGTVSYIDIGGSYLGDEDQDKHTLFIGRADEALGFTESRVYGLDLITGGRLVKPVEHEALTDAFVERIGIDIDEEGAELTSYKSMLTFYPQIVIRSGDGSSKFQFGANDYLANSPLWDTLQPFDPATQHKLDTRKAGRYIAYRFYHTGTSDFSFSGFDAELTKRGKR